MNDKKYHVHITGKTGLWNLNLRDLWGYRDLIVLLTRRDFSLRYRQTVLGPLWLIINPLLTCFAYVIIFNRVAGIGTEGIPGILYYLTGTAAWSFMQSILEQCSRTFNANAYIFGKVYFPRLVMPLSYALGSLIELGIRFVMIAAFCIWFQVRSGIVIPYARWVLVPLILPWLAFMGMGLGLLVSALTTKYRDLGILVGFGMRIWMYGTPVVYPIAALDEGILKSMIRWNPATAPIELFRYLVLGTQDPRIPMIAGSQAVTGLVLMLGLIRFGRIERTFMDTV